MEVSQGEEENTKTIFQQWSQEEIIFFYQEIWQKEDQEYEVQEVDRSSQFEDEELWQWFVIEIRIFEEETVGDRLKLFFRTNTREVKEKFQQQQVEKYEAYNNKAKLKIKVKLKQFRGYRIWKKRKENENCKSFESL